MRHRRPTQHWRTYRSGRYTFVNRGIFYRKRFRSFGSTQEDDERIKEEIKTFNIGHFQRLPKERQLKRIKHLQRLIFELQTDLERWRRKKRTRERAEYISLTIKSLETVIKERLDLLNDYMGFYKGK